MSSRDEDGYNQGKFYKDQPSPFAPCRAAFIDGFDFHVGGA
jgi:hypothetical protein